MIRAKSHMQTTLAFIAEYSDTRSHKTISITGENLTIPKLVAMADTQTRVTFSDETETLLQENRNFLDQRLRAGAVIYGVNTGYGGSSHVRPDDLHQIQAEALRIMTSGIGEKMERGTVRAVMLVRANSLARGYSGARPAICRALLDLYNCGATPVVPLRGSVSASGDLMPAAYIAGALAGMPNVKVEYRGEVVPAAEALSQAGLQPITFRAKEALAVINSSSVAACMAAEVLFDGSVAVLLTQAATALSVEALRGNTETFHPTVAVCLPHPGMTEVSGNIRHLLRGSSLAHHVLEVDRPDDPTQQKQDRYDLRTSPQWLGPALETMMEAIRRVTTELNSVSDNPLVDHRRGEVLQCGNFQGTAITVAMDQTRQAFQLCGRLLFAQYSQLINDHMNKGMTPNLCGGDPSTDFGMKGVDIAMASYASELDFLGTNMTNHVHSAELHNQSVNSLALISARYTREALKILQMMIACIFHAHAQSVDIRFLQHHVVDEIEVLSQQLSIPDLRKNTLKNEWHAVSFASATGLRDMFECPSLAENVPFERFHDKFNKLLPDIGKEKRIDEAAKLLGEDTRAIYIYIRKHLGVPFILSANRTPIDVNLEKIHQAVKNREINQLLPLMFRTAANKSML